MHYEFEQWIKDQPNTCNEWIAKDKKGQYINWIGQIMYATFVAGYNLGTHR